MVIKAVKGVKDILPEDSGRWQKLEKIARQNFARFGYKEIRLPIFEKTEVFIKSVGETSDIVQKEMYSFIDKGGENLTLRPEGTAACVRAYIQHSMFHPRGSITPLYYIGPMFRRERPQAGRFRQFHQIGAELFGASEPTADAEIIHLLMSLLTSIGLQKLRLLINSLGCKSCRPAYREALITFLQQRQEQLCESCAGRFEQNPLRVLDCKSEGCKQVIKDAPAMADHLCDDCKLHFRQLQQLLKDMGIKYEVDGGMVRGLDYYNRTVFEVVAEQLGAQNSVAGGGRYDSLVKSSGGPDVPAIGFGIGLERLIESAGENLTADDQTPDVYMVMLGMEAKNIGFPLAAKLRDGGKKVAYSLTDASMKNQLNRANKTDAKFAVIIGEDELAKNVAIIKDLATGEQSTTALKELAETILKS